MSEQSFYFNKVIDFCYVEGRCKFRLTSIKYISMGNARTSFTCIPLYSAKTKILRKNWHQHCCQTFMYWNHFFAVKSGYCPSFKGFLFVDFCWTLCNTLILVNLRVGVRGHFSCSKLKVKSFLNDLWLCPWNYVSFPNF